MLLSETIENLMKNTEYEDTFRKTFQGEIESVVRCKNVEFESVNKEEFTVL
jgi:hypothetical protein